MEGLNVTRGVMVLGYNSYTDVETVLDVVHTSEEAEAKDDAMYREYFKFTDFIECEILENGNGLFEGIEYEKR